MRQGKRPKSSSNKKEKLQGLGQRQKERKNLPNSIFKKKATVGCQKLAPENIKLAPNVVCRIVVIRSVLLPADFCAFLLEWGHAGGFRASTALQVGCACLSPHNICTSE